MMPGASRSRLKHRLRAVVDRAAAWTGALAARERALRGVLTILTYHRVLEDDAWGAAPLPGLAVPRSAFGAQVAWLARRFEIVDVWTGLGRLSAPGRRERPLLSITFDDGHRDSAQIAAPILEQARVRGTFFLVSGFVGSDRTLWFDCVARWHATASDAQLRSTLARVGRAADARERPTLRTILETLKSADPGVRAECVAAARNAVGESDADRAMTVEQSRALARAGHEIGAHSATHPILTREDDASLEREIVECKGDVERLAGVPVRGFCYPNGSFDERVLGVVGRAGYKYCCATRSGRVTGRENPLCLPRINMSVDHATFPRGVFSERRLRMELAWGDQRG